MPKAAGWFGRCGDRGSKSASSPGISGRSALRGEELFVAEAVSLAGLSRRPGQAAFANWYCWVISMISGCKRVLTIGPNHEAIGGRIGRADIDDVNFADLGMFTAKGYTAHKLETD